MRIVLLLTSLLLGIGASAQAVFEVKSPASVKGFYTIGKGDTTYNCSWGNGAVDQKNITAEVVLGLTSDAGKDATYGIDYSKMGCSSFTNDLTGKIAVVYRGSCSPSSLVYFSMKVKKAQEAGAVACIIINNRTIAQQNTQSNGSVTNGVYDFSGWFTDGSDGKEVCANPDLTKGQYVTLGKSITIPALMISREDGEKLLSEIAKGTVTAYIGGKQKLDYDLSINEKQLILPTKRTRPALLATEGLVSDTLGIKIFNKGKKENTQILATARITFKGNEIYADTFAVASIKADSSKGFYSFKPFKPTFDLEVGEYNLSYKVSNFNKDLQDTVIDEYLTDNTFSMPFYITDSIFAIGRIETYEGSNKKQHTNVPAWRYVTRPGGGTYKDYSSCIVFNEPGANKVQAEGMKFMAYAYNSSANPPVVLKGNKFKVSVLEWNDDFESVADTVKFDNIAPIVDNQEIDVTDSLVWDYIYAKFDYPVRFEEGKRYLFCASTSNQDIRFGYDNESPSLGASVWVANLQPLVPIKIDSKYYFTGFNTGDSTDIYGNSYIPSISLEIGKNTSLSIEEKSILESSFNVYPNPASSVVNVSFKLENNSNVNVTVSDLTGKVVYTNKVNKTTGSNSFAIDTKGLNSGMYVVSVTSENGVATRRVSIEK